MKRWPCVLLPLALALSPTLALAKKKPPAAEAPPPPSVALGVEKWRAGDYAAAVAIWGPFADANDPDALFDMGQAYKLGRGVPTDLAKARDYYRRAATLGSRPAQANLGIMLFQAGEKPEAVQWLAKAADRGEPRAQYVLGVAAYNGDGVRRNAALGYAYVSLAARGGVPQAATTLSGIAPRLSGQDRINGDAIAASIAAGAGVPPQFALSTTPRLITAPSSAPAAPPPVPGYSRNDVLKPPPAPPPAAVTAPPPKPPGYAYSAPPPRAVPSPVPIVTAPPPAPAPMAVAPRPAAPPPPIAAAPRPAPPPPQIAAAAAPPPPVPIVTTPPVALPPPVVRTAPVAASTPVDDASDPPPTPAPKPVEKPAAKSAKPADKPVAKAADKPAEKPAPAGWRVQLGAYSTRAKAENVWDGVKAKQKAAIGSAKPVFEPAGGIVKLQIGPYASASAARDACEKLSAAGTACFTVAPR